MSAPEQQTAFVAGSTGYTGREVVRALRERGIATVAHIRPASSRLSVWKPHFEELGATVDQTAWDAAALEERFTSLRPTLVFALLGITRASAKKEERGGAQRPSYDSVDYGMTAMLISAASAIAPRPRFVYLSSTGLPKAEPSKGSYMHARWRVERELAASDLPYVAARPSFITGSDRDENRPGERIGASVADSALAMAGIFGMRKLRDRYSSTTNVALAEALVRIGLDASLSRCVVESEKLR